VGVGEEREGVDIVDGIKGPKLFNLLKRRERGKKMGNGKWEGEAIGGIFFIFFVLAVIS